MKPLRIVVTGPESVGKTTLCDELASRHQAPWVEEYSRIYLKKIGINYTYNDLKEIAKYQETMEEKVSEKAEELYFCDTDILTIKVWSEVVFGELDPWIRETWKKKSGDLYLLLYPDLEWEEDPLRENPNDRESLFELYENELKNRDLPYQVITGQGDKRTKKALEAVDKLRKNQ